MISLFLIHPGISEQCIGICDVQWHVRISIIVIILLIEVGFLSR